MSAVFEQHPPWYLAVLHGFNAEVMPQVLEECQRGLGQHLVDCQPRMRHLLDCAGVVSTADPRSGDQVSTATTKHGLDEEAHALGNNGGQVRVQLRTLCELRIGTNCNDEVLQRIATNNSKKPFRFRSGLPKEPRFGDTALHKLDKASFTICPNLECRNCLRGQDAGEAIDVRS